MELFNTSVFSSENDALRDFETETLSSKKKVVRSLHKSDPAWDNNSTFDSSPKAKDSDCWYTPTEIVNLVQQCLDGITLDPCADDGKHIESCQHLTIADDGLSRQWFGRVFMNPPYSCPGIWIAKLQEEFNCGRVEEAIALVPVATDTKWFHPLISSNLICFWKGRIKFLDVSYQPKLPARQSHCLIYWGKNQPRFRGIFSPFGSFNLVVETATLTDSSSLECDRWNPDDFGESPAFLADGDQLTIFYDDTKEPPDPDDFASLDEYNEAWKQWQLVNLISAQELEQDSATQACSLDSNSLELQKPTITAQVFSQSDIQKSTTTGMCDRLPLKEDLDSKKKQLTLSQPALPAPPSPQRDLDLVQPTSVIASPQYCESSTTISQNSPLSKTLLVCSPVRIPQEMSKVTSGAFFNSFPLSGMMRNGLLSEADIVPVPLLENEYCWLPSPGALSSTGKGRPPGQTKQEAELKDLGAIARNQVINPEFLESTYNLPLGWTDPQEDKSALELLAEMELYAIAEQPLVTHLIPELQRSHSVESCTSTQSQADLTPEFFLEETEPQQEDVQKPKSRERKGCLYKYIENKKLKSGAIASYPRVMEHRNPDNPKHWRWGFNWEEKIDGEWKGRSIGSVPIGAIALIQSMQKSSVPLEEIIELIKRSKKKK